MILYFLSKGRFELAKKEIESLGSKIKELEKGIVVGDKVSYNRLALTKRAGKFLGVFDEKELFNFFKEWEGENPVKVEVIENSSKKRFLMSYEKKIGEILHKKGYRIDMKNFKEKIVVIKGKKFYIFKEEWVRKPFFDHNKLPFKRPYMLKTRDARLLVNLSGAKKEILDPFCGTGVILIEALKMGIKGIGIDIDEKNIKGCKRNLEFLGLEGKVIFGDSTKLSKYINKIEAIATDPPYFRSTKKTNEDLYNKFFEEARKVLKGRMAIILPFYPKVDNFKIEFVYGEKIHKNLTRYWCVLS